MVIVIIKTRTITTIAPPQPPPHVQQQRTTIDVPGGLPMTCSCTVTRSPPAPHSSRPWSCQTYRTQLSISPPTDFST